MLGKIFNTFFPMREFLNYLFKKTLGDYILNDLDLNKIEIEITNKAFISLKNIDLNASEINKKHLNNFPFLMLEGHIKEFDLSFSLDKISINIDKISILLMPLFNKEKTKTLVSKKQIPVKIIENVQLNNLDSTNEFENIGFGERKEKSEFSLVSSFLNSALNNLEINILNITINTLLYEASNTVQDNPILSLFVSEICLRKKNQNDISLIVNNENFKKAGFMGEKKDKINLDKLEYKAKNNHENSNGINNDQANLVNSKTAENGSQDNQAKNKENSIITEVKSTFLNDKILLVDKIILKIISQNQNIEQEFFEMTSVHEEKSIFNFFCHNSSILAFDFKSSGYSLLVDFSEPKSRDELSTSDAADSFLMNVNIDLKKFEICLNPLQLQILLSYFDVYKIISFLEKNNFNVNEFNQTKNIATEEKNQFYKIKFNKPFKLISTVINKMKINFFFEGFNFILLESNYMKDLPKLWSFFQENYNKKIDNIHALEAHYSYMEDNFFLFNFCKLYINITQNFSEHTESMLVTIEKMFLKYVEFVGKKQVLPSSANSIRITFNNKGITQSFCNEKFNSSKALFSSQMYRSKSNFMTNSKLNSYMNTNNNNPHQQSSNIYNSNVYFMDKSMNRSHLSIYESVREYEEPYSNIENSVFKRSMNQTIYQSTLESKDALLERYNKIFESEYMHESYSILEIVNNSICEKICLSVKLLTCFISKPDEHYGQICSVKEKCDKNKNCNVDVDSNSSVFNYSTFYGKIIIKKIDVIFNPLYIFKLTRLFNFSHLIINEFLYLVENKTLENKNYNNDINRNDTINEEKIECKVEKASKENDGKKIANDEVNDKNTKDKITDAKASEEVKFKKTFYQNYASFFKGFHEKTKQISVLLEEVNIKIHTVKKDLFDEYGKCLTSSNSNSKEEYSNYEEYMKNGFNMRFLSDYFVEFFKENIDLFSQDEKYRTFNKNLIGTKLSIKMDKPIKKYILVKDFLEINLINHKIFLDLINTKRNKKINFSKICNLSYLDRVLNIYYDFSEINLSCSNYSILKLKANIHKFTNKDIRLINKSERNKNLNLTPNEKLTKNNHYEQVQSQNNIIKEIIADGESFQSSPFILEVKQDLLLEQISSIIEHDNKSRLYIAKDKINKKIEKMYLNHKINLIQNNPHSSEKESNPNKELLNVDLINFDESEDSNSNILAVKRVEKIKMNLELSDQIIIKTEPQHIFKALSFFDSLLFSLNLSKIISKKQSEIYNFYKEIYFTSLNIDNFNDFSFYCQSNDIYESKIKSYPLKDPYKFMKLNCYISNISLLVLKNNAEDYLYLQNDKLNITNNNYLLKLDFKKILINLISLEKEDLSILVSIDDMQMATYKNKKFSSTDCSISSNNNDINIRNEVSKDKNSLYKNKEIISKINCEDNLLLYKADCLIDNFNIFPEEKDINPRVLDEMNLHKFFKKKSNNIITMLIKLKSTKLQSQQSGRSLKQANFSFENKLNSVEKLKSNKLSLQENLSSNLLLDVERNSFICNEFLDNTMQNKSNMKKIGNQLDAIEYGLLMDKLDLLIDQNLIFQGDTSLDLLIILNDIILTPLFYNNLDFEDIKTFKKEFFPDMHNKKEYKENKNIKHSAAHSSIKGKLDIAMSTKRNNISTSFEDSNSANFIDIQNNLRILTDKEILTDSSLISNQINKIKIFSKNEPLKNLFSSSNLFVEINFDINKLSLDLFFSKYFNLLNESLEKSSKIAKANDNNFQSYLVKKDQIRIIIHIEKITYSKEIKAQKENVTRILKIKNLNAFLLKDLTHKYAELQLLKIYNEKFSENSVYKLLGFVEILNINSIQISIEKKLILSKTNGNNLIFNDIGLKIGDIEVNLCRDSLECLIQSADIGKNLIDKIKGEFNLNKNNDYTKEAREREIKDLANTCCFYEDNGKTITKQGCDKEDLNSTNDVRETKLTELDSINDNYFDQATVINNNNNNLIVVEDYLKKSDSQKSFRKKSINESDLINIDSTRNEPDNVDIERKKEPIKEELIINFALESAKIYLFSGADFDFINQRQTNDSSKNSMELLIESFERKEKFKQEFNDYDFLSMLSENLFQPQIKIKKEKVVSFYCDEFNNFIAFEEFSQTQKKNIPEINANKNSSETLVSSSPKQNKNNFDSNNANNIHNFKQCYFEPNRQHFESTATGFLIIEEFYNKNNVNEIHKKNDTHIDSFDFKIENSISNSFLKVSTKQKKFNIFLSKNEFSRKKQNVRDYDNHVSFSIQALKLKINFFPDNERIFLNIYLNMFDIDDYIKNSKYKKIISKYSLENVEDLNLYNNCLNWKKINKYKNKIDKPLVDLDLDIVKINQTFSGDKPAETRRLSLFENISTKISDDSILVENPTIAISNNKNNKGNVETIDILDNNEKIFQKLENDLFYIDGYISPIIVLLDQATLIFFLDFFFPKGTKIHNPTEHKSGKIQAASKTKKLNFKKIKDPLEIIIQEEKKEMQNDSDSK